MGYKRKTVDEWQIWGDFGQGMEELSAYTSFREARDDIRLYRQEQPEGVYWLRKKRVKRDDTQPDNKSL